MTEIDDGPARRTPWYASTTFYAGPFAIVLGTLVSAGLAVAWFVYGGLPHDYDGIGVVAVPGRAVLELPAGRVMLDHADDVADCYDNHVYEKNASIYQAPDGLVVRVTPVAGGDPLEVTSVPAWLGESDSGCRGHEPYGRIDVPTAGRYLVETTDAEHGPLAADAPGAELPTGGGRSTSGTGIAFGPRPWTPLGSPLVGAVLLFLLGTALSCLPLLVTRRFLRAGTHADPGSRR